MFYKHYYPLSTDFIGGTFDNKDKSAICQEICSMKIITVLKKHLSGDLLEVLKFLLNNNDKAVIWPFLSEIKNKYVP